MAREDQSNSHWFVRGASSRDAKKETLCGEELTPTRRGHGNRHCKDCLRQLKSHHTSKGIEYAPEKRTFKGRLRSMFKNEPRE